MKLRPLATNVRVSDKGVQVSLADGREIKAPLTWFLRLQSASRRARSNWRLIGGGVGIHWDEIDEDISVAALLAK